MAQVIKRLHVLKRAGLPEVLFGMLTRDADTDALYYWSGSAWVLVLALEGTDLIYDTVTWRNKVYIADGKHKIVCVADEYDELDCQAIGRYPVVQYLVVFQDRLVGAGDSRIQAEVEADGGLWPVDSNRDRVLFCEALDPSQWSANNFIDANVGTGEVISGLGVNSITSATRGAQSQLVVFKPSSVLINDGVLGSGDQRLNMVSQALGCPGYQTIANTPFGLMFCAKTTVCIMDTSGKEPTQIGLFIHPEIEQIPDHTSIYSSLRARSCAIFHRDTYKMSIANAGSVRNDREWWLDLRPAVFPQEHNWYGPHTGDFIGQYVIFNNELVGYEYSTNLIWKLDVEGEWGSMNDPNAARNSIMTWGRVQVPGLKRGMLDAYGFRGVIEKTLEVDPGESEGEEDDTLIEAPVTFNESIDCERGEATFANTFSVPVNKELKAYYDITRPIRRPAYDAQVTVSHDDPSDVVVDSIYLRAKVRERQAEKMDESTQG